MRATVNGTGHGKLFAAASRQHQSMVICIVGNDRHRSLGTVQAVCPGVVVMAGIPLLLGVQPVVPVPLQHGCQSIGLLQKYRHVAVQVISNS